MKSFEDNKKVFKYTGAFHIHSLFSDGTGSINDTAHAAKQAGLDWIIITDHNNMSISEGIIDGVTVIKGEEISPAASNHYLALGIDKCIMPLENLQDAVNAVKEAGGFGFAAHPDESENRKNPYKPIKWTDKEIIPDGIEIWNWFSEWADNYESRNIFTQAYAYLFKDRLVKKPYAETMEWFDSLNSRSEKIIPAIGGIDAHALKTKKYFLPLCIFPYKTMFKTILNKIILDKPLEAGFEKRKMQILNALKEGRNIIFNRRICSKAPEIYIKNDLEAVFPGGSIILDLNTYLYFNCTKRAEIIVYKDGREYAHLKAQSTRIKISGAGKYRIEALIKGFGYAYSNPFIVKEG